MEKKDIKNILRENIDKLFELGTVDEMQLDEKNKKREKEYLKKQKQGKDEKKDDYEYVPSIRQYDKMTNREKEKAKKKGEKKDNKKDEPTPDKGKRAYPDVRSAFEKIGGPSMVDIMKIAFNMKDDKKGVNRSLFRKKVKQIKNPDTGAYYQFDDEELAKVRKAIDSVR